MRGNVHKTTPFSFSQSIFWKTPPSPSWGPIDGAGKRFIHLAFGLWNNSLPREWKSFDFSRSATENVNGLPHTVKRCEWMKHFQFFFSTGGRRHEKPSLNIQMKWNERENFSFFFQLLMTHFAGLELSQRVRLCVTALFHCLPVSLA